MITITEAFDLPTAKLEPDEEKMLATVLKKAEQTIHEEFDGLGAYVTVPADQATARVMAEACRKISVPLTYSLPSMYPSWTVNLYFNFVQTPSMVTGGAPRNRLISYLLIIAVDTISENILRVRRETAS